MKLITAILNAIMAFPVGDSILSNSYHCNYTNYQPQLITPETQENDHLFDLDLPMTMEEFHYGLKHNSVDIEHLYTSFEENDCEESSDCEMDKPNKLNEIDHYSTIPSIDDMEIQTENEAEVSDNNTQVHFYKMARGISIKQIWQEYKYGLNGGPSIESLNQKYGIKWRSTRNARDIYRCRYKIYRAISKLINSQGKTEDEAIDLIQSNPQLACELVQNTLHRNLKTVGQIWDEYKIGLNGKQSIENLDKEYGGSWRNSSSENSFYYKRKRIYDAIIKASKNGKSEHEAVKELENYRIRNNWTVSQLQMQL